MPDLQAESGGPTTRRAVMSTTAWPTVNGLPYCPDHGAILPGDNRCPYLLTDRWSTEAVERHPVRPTPPGEHRPGGSR